jgi:hypothetical protein
MLAAAVQLGDECRADAMKEAAELLKFMGPDSCVTAVVGADGLVLIFDTDKPELKAWHFQTIVAGYKGRVPWTAATILEMFGFGGVDEIFEQISQGGTGNYFVFTKRVSATSD